MAYFWSVCVEVLQDLQRSCCAAGRRDAERLVRFVEQPQSGIRARPDATLTHRRVGQPTRILSGAIKGVFDVTVPISADVSGTGWSERDA